MKKLILILASVIFLQISFATIASSQLNLNDSLQTPLERHNFSQLSRYDELVSYLQQVDRVADKLSVEVTGNSVQGRSIFLVKITEDSVVGSKREIKPMVLIYAQQHGNEPSGKEAALMLIKEFALGQWDEIIEKLDVLIVPQVNPDGAEMDQRRNANDVDLNRSHAIFNAPETVALHRIFQKWLPEVALDVHEYNAMSKNWVEWGFIRTFDEQLGAVTNLNISGKLKSYSHKNVLPFVEKYLQKKGFSFHRYIVGGPPPKARIRYSTTSINDGRTSMGIYNTLSFILEGKKYGDVLTNIQKRTKGQLLAMQALLIYVANHAEEILTLIHGERERLKQLGTVYSEEDTVYLRMDYFKDRQNGKLPLPLFDVRQKKDTLIVVENFAPLVKSKLGVIRPIGYVIPGKEDSLIPLLQQHGVEMEKLERPVEVLAEIYRIKRIEEINEEDKKSIDVKVTMETKKIKLSEGDWIIKTAQLRSNLICILLEPQSGWGLVQYESYHKWLRENKIFPIYRIIRQF